ncbi:MAG: VWA domain-containing protein [Polyangiaceae bacterium]|nr:VWA domain-containing protein [Polyangiaceae bacterium]
MPELHNPKGLFLLLLAIPIVLLYVLKVRRERRVVGSTWLWAEARRDLTARHPWKRLRAEVPLALQLLGLLGLALAFAEPALRGRGSSGRTVGIVIDTSASMGVREGDATRIDLGKRAAHDTVDRLPPGGTAFLVEAGREPKFTLAKETDTRRLHQAIDRIAATEEEGDLAGALAIAADRLRSEPDAELVLVTDGALAKETPLVAQGVPVRIVKVGARSDNAGIVAVDTQADGSAAGSAKVQTFALVHNFGAVARDVYVTASLEDAEAPVASRRVLLAPGVATPVVLGFQAGPTDGGKGIVVRISGSDALAADDVAYGRVPMGARLPVVFAGDQAGSWARRALAADGSIALQELSLAQLFRVNVDPEALVVAEGACPESGASEAPGLDWLVFLGPGATQTSCSGVRFGPSVENPRVTSWDRADGRLRFLTLDGLHLRRARTLVSSTALMRAEEGVIAADAGVPGRMVTVVGFDPAESDWPLRASFVLFMRNVVELARAHRAQGTTAPGRTGEPLRVPVPTSTTQVLGSGPGLDDRAFVVRGGLATIPAMARAGVYHFRWTAPRTGAVVVPVNLVSAAESDVAPRDVTVTTTAGGAATKAPTRGAGIELYLAALALLVLLTDYWYFTRAARKTTPSLRRREASLPGNVRKVAS